MPIPWDKVILHGPQILDAARGLYGKWQTRTKVEEIDPAADMHVQLRELAAHLKAVEEGEAAQSGIIQQLAEQSQAISIGVDTLKRQLADIEAQAEYRKKTESDIRAQVQEYSERLEKLERRGAANSKKQNLALYAAVAALAIASASLIGVLAR